VSGVHCLTAATSRVTLYTSMVTGIIQATEPSRPHGASFPVAILNRGAAGLVGTMVDRSLNDPRSRVFQWALPLTRLISRISVNPVTGCWEWLGSTSGSTMRYGSMRVGMKSKLVHRVSWEQFIGPIPDGLRVCHSCDNSLCANPHHLWLGTDQDNVRDCRNKGRGVYAPGLAAIAKKRCPDCGGAQEKP
jgi:hypothetical protein